MEEMTNRLAASITKIRIEKQALDLQSLLPIHLRDEKVARAVTNPIISGWLNRFKKLLVTLEIPGKSQINIFYKFQYETASNGNLQNVGLHRASRKEKRRQ